MALLFADAADGLMLFAIWLTLALTCWFFNVGRLAFTSLVCISFAIAPMATDRDS